VIPVVAIDYSLSNLTFKQSRQLMHSLKVGEDNSYISILKHIQKVYQNLTPYILGFGMGGKTLPKQQNASDIFSLSGDIFNPIVKKDQLVEKYSEVFEKIKVSLPIKYAPVMKLVSEFAKYEKENHKARNFYSLIYITPGVIDDINDTVETAQMIGGLPMSLTIIKLNNEQLEDVNDARNLNDVLGSEYRAADRKFFTYLEYDEYKDNNKLDLFEELLIKDIPMNVKRYLSKNNVFAYELEGADFESRVSVKQKTHGLPLFQSTAKPLDDGDDEVWYNAKSMDEEEKIGTCDESILYQTASKSRNLPTERGSSSDESQRTWYKDYRRLSYSKIMEQEYINLAPEDDPIMKSKLEELVKSGLVFDQSKDYMHYLLSLENEQGN
jgi:hypothetical protein